MGLTCTRVITRLVVDLRIVAHDQLQDHILKLFLFSSCAIFGENLLSLRESYLGIIII